MNRFFVCLFSTFFLLGATSPVVIYPAPKSLIRQMIDETNKVSSLAYTMRKVERINGKMSEQIADIKFNRSPYKVYARQRHPNDGLEILFVKGQNRERVLINPNGFPWMNVNLDPHCYQMRKDQHHTVLDTGYDLVMGILEHLVDKYNNPSDDILKIIDVVKVDGKNCWLMELNNPHFRYESYTVQEGETLISIAKKFMLSEHMILEKNEEVDSYTDVKAGQTIRIPNDYCPKMILTIEQERMIPMIMNIHDDQGLYELYEFTNVNVNPTLKEEEFTRAYKDYGF